MEFEGDSVEQRRLEEKHEVEDEDMVTGNLDVKNDNLLENLGFALLALFGVLLFVILVLLIKWFVVRNYRIYRAYNNFKRKIFWNFWIRFFMQSYLKYQISWVGTLFLLSFADNAFKTVMTILAEVFILAVWIVLIWILHKHRN